MRIVQDEIRLSSRISDGPDPLEFLLKELSRVSISLQQYDMHNSQHPATLRPSRNDAQRGLGKTAHVSILAEVHR